MLCPGCPWAVCGCCVSLLAWVWVLEGRAQGRSAPEKAGATAARPLRGVPDPHLDQGSADVGLLEQEDVIRTVVEPFNAVSGCLEDFWIVGVYRFGKSWLHVWAKGLGTNI